MFSFSGYYPPPPDGWTNVHSHPAVEESSRYLTPSASHLVLSLFNFSHFGVAASQCGLVWVSLVASTVGQSFLYLLAIVHPLLWGICLSLLSIFFLFFF